MFFVTLVWGAGLQLQHAITLVVIKFTLCLRWIDIVIAMVQRADKTSVQRATVATGAPCNWFI